MAQSLQIVDNYLATLMHRVGSMRNSSQNLAPHCFCECAFFIAQCWIWTLPLPLQRFSSAARAVGIHVADLGFGFKPAEARCLTAGQGLRRKGVARGSKAQPLSLDLVNKGAGCGVSSAVSSAERTSKHIGFTFLGTGSGS